LKQILTFMRVRKLFRFLNNHLKRLNKIPCGGRYTPLFGTCHFVIKLFDLIKKSFEWSAPFYD
ncbi:hypothetical protein KAI60_00805, partial [Candidatus Bathyarchaeota archaeon]|nr:hypothetical protein [Candidatus Bathyarchaeota archaeon]